MGMQSMMLKGEAPASVQCAALRSLSHVLSAIDTVPTSDAKIFNECAPYPSFLNICHLNLRRRLAISCMHAQGCCLGTD